MSTRKNRVEAERVSPTAIAVVNALNTMTDHIIEHGFLYYDRSYWNLDVSLLSDGFVNTYTKKVCKELGRPWIRATGGYSDEYQWSQQPDGKYKRVSIGKRFGGHLTVPKRNYLAPVVAPLLMIAGAERHNAVFTMHGRGTWEFHFNNQHDDARGLWENHIQFMRTDETARKALKLLPK